MHVYFRHLSCCYIFVTKPGDDHRSTFFKDHLKRLAHAAAGGFDTLQQACKLTQSLIDDVYPSVTTSSTRLQQLQTVPVHLYSKSILPQGWKHVQPLICYGDGNCLYRYSVQLNFIGHTVTCVYSVHTFVYKFVGFFSLAA